MTNMEFFFILTLLCTIFAGSKGIRSTSKVEKVNPKTRCSSRTTFHRLEEKSDEKQSDSAESKESEESDERNSKADQELTVGKTEERVNVKDAIPEEETSPKKTDSIDMMPAPGKTECMDRDDDLCWDFEKEGCNYLEYLNVLPGYACESDKDCEESDPCQSGKCCEIPCDNEPKTCRYPTADHDLVDSFIPEWDRDQ